MNDLERVRLVLVAHRRARQPFDVAWPRALAVAPKDWVGALEATSSAWRCAYEGTGDVAVRAMTMLEAAA